MSLNAYNSDSEEDEETGLLGATRTTSKDCDDDSPHEELLAGDLSESDDDEAPEDIGFSESRQTVIQKVKDTLKQISEDKQNLKERRKRKEELYKQQKEQRLQALEQKRLPENFLEDLPAEPAIKRKKTPEKVQKNTERLVDVGSHSDKASGSEGEGDDFLPLESEGGIEAVSLTDFLKKPKSSLEKAMEFRQSRQYGSNVPRESAQEYKGRLLKRKARKK